MSSRKILVASIILSCCSPIMARAQCDQCSNGSGDIRVVRIPAGLPAEDMFCTAAGSDFEIDLGAYDWTSNPAWTIHVYDCSTSGQLLPDHSIGLITLRGDPEGLESIHLLVAGESQTWDPNPRSDLAEGAVNFSGVHVNEVNVLNKTTASVAIAGDITQVATAPAGLHANAFVRLQARGRDGGTLRLGGEIDAPSSRKALGFRVRLRLAK